MQVVKLGKLLVQTFVISIREVINRQLGEYFRALIHKRYLARVTE